MATRQDQFEALAFREAPPLDPAWVQYVSQMTPPKQFPSALERQPIYAQDRRDLLAQWVSSDGLYPELGQGVERVDFTIPSSLDGVDIPVLQLDLTERKNDEPELVIIYYHGGGLHVGEADSEELSCRQLLKSGLGVIRVYSIGYRLMPTNPASTCISDSMDGFRAFCNVGKKTVIVGSSSGGQLATMVSQAVPKDSFHGVLLRGPVTADARSGMQYVPERFHPFHTSVSETFLNTNSRYLERLVPRDGADRLPLEADPETLRGMPRTWIQASTNDTLYSDALCYAMLLREAGVDVVLEVIKGFPHTFWLGAPELPSSIEADAAMLKGLRWVLG